MYVRMASRARAACPTDTLSAALCKSTKVEGNPKFSDRAIDGNDLLEIGIEPGPELGSLLCSLLDQVIVGPQPNTNEQLLNRVKYEMGRE